MNRYEFKGAMRFEDGRTVDIVNYDIPAASAEEAMRMVPVMIASSMDVIHERLKAANMPTELAGAKVLVSFVMPVEDPLFAGMGLAEKLDFSGVKLDS